MKVQQLISAGFAITAIAAASMPAVGWTLLGEAVLERPAVSVVETSWEAAPALFDTAPARPMKVALRLADPSDRAANDSTPW